MIIWAYAFFLTAGGAYNFTGCSPDVPSSNIIVDACRRHAYAMKHCRTDVSSAWRTAAWVRIPYPLQWGVPIFHIKTSIIMIMVSLVSSVDSVSIFKTHIPCLFTWCYNNWRGRLSVTWFPSLEIYPRSLIRLRYIPKSNIQDLYYGIFIPIYG